MCIRDRFCIIGNIRQKLRQVTTKEYIQTVWGVGYKFVDVPGAVSYTHLDVYKRQPVDSLPVQVSGIRPADWEQERLRAVRSRSEERLRVHRDWSRFHRHKDVYKRQRLSPPSPLSGKAKKEVSSLPTRFRDRKSVV